MKYNFFTFGGGQFWEDVFFYQKWRIQRNCKSKAYRLLDPWDIRRYEGSFEECRQAFVKFVGIYQLTRQKGHMIVMIHGLGETKNIFKPLWRKALEKGFLAAAVNYPSTRKHIDSHVQQFNFFLNHLEDVQEVSFVTNGIGAIILRKLFESKEPWMKRLKINRAVMVCPPNQGSLLMTWANRFFIFRKLLGPVLSEANPENVNPKAKLSENIETGIITTRESPEKQKSIFPESWRKYLHSRKEAEIFGASDIAVIKNRRLNPFKNPKIINAVMAFLENGKFK